MTRETKQAQTLLQVFESLGVPLMGAVAEVQLWSGGLPSQEETARQFAALLSASISLGTKMAEKLKPATPEAAQTARLDASAMAAGLIAQHYALNGQMPDEAFTRRALEAYDSTLSLADSFTAHDKVALDDPAAQRALALLPLIQAMMRFPFGLSENQLIQQLGEDLCERAKNLAQLYGGSVQVQDAHEIAFLKGCANLLARVCDVEMSRLDQQYAAGNTNTPAPEQIINAIWLKFDDGLDVLRGVIGFASGNTTSTQGEYVIRTSTPRAKENIAVETPAIQQVEDGPFNPMAFFAKPDKAEGA